MLKRHPHITAAFLIAAVVCVSYGNTLDASFHFDDYDNIVKAPYVHDMRLFLHPGQVSTGPNYNLFMTRLSAFFTFALNYQFHGADVTGYHLVNIALHSLNALLLYVLVLLTCRTDFMAGSVSRESGQALALLSAILFAVHPVQTQTVTYIVQRFALLATFFILLSFVCYTAAVAGQRGNNRRKLVLYVLAVVCMALAQNCKEVAFTAPVALVLYDMLFLKGTPGHRLRRLAPLLATMVIIPTIVVLTQGNLGSAMDYSSLSVTSKAAALTPYEYLLTESRVIVTYLRLLFIPVSQNVDYDYPLIRSAIEPSVIMSVLVLSALAGWALVAIGISRQGSPLWRLAGFGIFWFFIFLAVESSVIPIADVIFEHRLYLPSAGFIAGISATLFALAGSRYKNPRILLPVVMILALLVMATVMRNSVWQSELTLWQDAAAKSPGKARPHVNLGVAYIDQGRYDEGLRHLEQAVRLEPRYVTALFNLGFFYLNQGNLYKSGEYFSRVLNIDPTHAEAKAYYDYIVKAADKKMRNIR